jgi:regulation of enolase protein 1 (concanavalin A-like superfamily)
LTAETQVSDPFHTRSWSWIGNAEPWDIGGPDRLRWSCSPGSDFWRLTASDIVKYDGSAYVTRIEADFAMSGRLEAKLEARYDQVGMLVSAAEDHWVKAGAEWEGELLVGAVHTRGHSDWSMGPGTLPLNLRIERRAGVLEVCARGDEDDWRVIRQLALDGPVLVGPYSCAPAGPGFQAELTAFSLDVDGTANG